MYVLQLQHGCYYVGKTAHLTARLAAHAAGEGSDWTRLHPPLSPGCALAAVRVPRAAAAGEETRQTAALMLAHGVNAVRGAELCEPRPYTVADQARIVALIGHHLNLRYEDVRAAVQGQLREGSARGRQCAPWGPEGSEEGDEPIDAAGWSYRSHGLGGGSPGQERLGAPTGSSFES